MTQAFIVGTVVLGALCMAFLMFPKGVVYALGCSQRLENYAMDYLLWLLPGLVFLYFECVGMMSPIMVGTARKKVNSAAAVRLVPSSNAPMMVDMLV